MNLRARVLMISIEFLCQCQEFSTSRAQYDTFVGVKVYGIKVSFVVLRFVSLSRVPSYLDACSAML